MAFGAAKNRTLEQKAFSRKNDARSVANGDDGALKLAYANVIFVGPGVQIDET